MLEPRPPPPSFNDRENPQKSADRSPFSPPGHLRSRGKPKLNIQKCQGNFLLNTHFTGNSRAVHIGLGTFTAGGTKIPQAAQTEQNQTLQGQKSPRKSAWEEGKEAARTDGNQKVGIGKGGGGSEGRWGRRKAGRQ